MISSVKVIHYEQMGRTTMAYQTVNPYDNQVVATFDDVDFGERHGGGSLSSSAFSCACQCSASMASAMP